MTNNLEGHIVLLYHDAPVRLVKKQCI